MVPGGYRPDPLELRRIEQEKEAIRQYQQVRIKGRDRGVQTPAAGVGVYMSVSRLPFWGEAGEKKPLTPPHWPGTTREFKKTPRGPSQADSLLFCLCFFKDKGRREALRSAGAQNNSLLYNLDQDN